MVNGMWVRGLKNTNQCSILLSLPQSTHIFNTQNNKKTTQRGPRDDAGRDGGVRHLLLLGPGAGVLRRYICINVYTYLYVYVCTHVCMCIDIQNLNPAPNLTKTTFKKQNRGLHLREPHQAGAPPDAPLPALLPQPHRARRPLFAAVQAGCVSRQWLFIWVCICISMCMCVYGRVELAPPKS